MSKLSFISHCVAYYAEHIGQNNTDIYELFKREGVIAFLENDYDDLHGMGMEYLMQMIDDYLGRKRVIVYHGSTLDIKEPRIITSEIGRDFGFAFYTTDIREQAERWAIRRAKLQSRNQNRPIPAIVNVYEWYREQNLKIKEYQDASFDWLEMVVNCRSNIGYRHDYDIVIGKIANDNVGETVSYVVQGIMRKEDAIERLKFEKINNQIAFCTEASLAQLKYVKSYTVEG